MKSLIITQGFTHFQMLNVLVLPNVTSAIGSVQLILNMKWSYLNLTSNHENKNCSFTTMYAIEVVKAIVSTLKKSDESYHNPFTYSCTSLINRGVGAA